MEWVLAQSTSLRTRQQVLQMWQALMVEGVIQHGELPLRLRPPPSLTPSPPPPTAVHKVHPFLDDSQLYYRFADLRPQSEAFLPGKLQQLMSLFSFSRNSTAVGSSLSNSDGLSHAQLSVANGRPR